MDGEANVSRRMRHTLPSVQVIMILRAYVDDGYAILVIWGRQKMKLRALSNDDASALEFGQLVGNFFCIIRHFFSLHEW